MLMATLVLCGCQTERSSGEGPPTQSPSPKTASPPALKPTESEAVQGRVDVWPAEPHKVVNVRSPFRSPKPTGSLFCVRSWRSAQPPKAGALKDQLAFGGPCWGAFSSKSAAEQKAKNIGLAYPFVVRLPTQRVYRHERDTYRITEAPFLVELGYIENAFSTSRPLERDTVVVETGYCSHADTYRGPAFVLDGPTGRAHLFRYVWGVAPAGPQKLFLSLGLIVGKQSEDLTPAITALGKRFGVSSARVKSSLFFQGDAEPEDTDVELGYLAELDLQTGKVRELPVLGGTEMWFNGSEVLSTAYPSLCRTGAETMGGVQYLSRNPMKWIPRTEDQVDADMQSLFKARSTMAGPGTTAVVGKPVAVTRDHSIALFVGSLDDIAYAVLQLGQRTSKSTERKRR